MDSLKKLLEREVFERDGRIRYYSGFNLDGFFKGYNDGRFDKSAMSRDRHVWFYVGDNLIAVYYCGKPTQNIGTDKDYLDYFLAGFMSRRCPAIRNAVGSALSRVGSRSIPNYEPCVFSGLIPIKEIIDAGSTTWYVSKGPIVPVDKLYKVKKTGRTVDISDELML